MRVKLRVSVFVLWLVLFLSTVLLLAGYASYMYDSGLMWVGFGMSLLSYIWVCIRLALDIVAKRTAFMLFYFLMVLLVPYLSMIYYLIRYETVWELRSYREAH